MLGLILTLLPVMAQGAEPPVWEFGLRGGMEATGSAEQYRVGEAYLLRDLPWRSSLAGGTLAARLDLGAGYLESDNDGGGWLAVGADLVWQIIDGFIEVEAGFRPTWLIDHAYGSDDFGGDLQFSSHGGIALRLPPFVISYRYQHTSNASLYDDNDGFDLHLFGVGTKF
jgi:hypothetical protein